jgi:hypothetical protein
LLADAAPSNASARAPNFPAAFLDAPLFFFAPRSAVSVFALGCAPSCATLLVNATIPLIRMTAAHRRPTFSIFILRSRVNRPEKYSRKATYSILRASYFLN